MVESKPMNYPAAKILMVRPTGFGYNPETAESNSFQKQMDLEAAVISERARKEFDEMAAGLLDLGVDLVVLDEDRNTVTPDAVFPNNWFSTHPDRTFCLYPMESKARQLERGLEDQVLEHFKATRKVDLTPFERDGKFLEGTGSLVLDHENRIAFVGLSSRSDITVLEKWSSEMEYGTCVFRSFDSAGNEVYHTNVMMCLGTGFAVACTESITDETERMNFVSKMKAAGRELIEITHRQMNSFAGNMIQIAAKDGRSLIAMSSSAHRSLTSEQMDRLGNFCQPVAFDIGTIEKCGGGSVRCMIAELF